MLPKIVTLSFLSLVICACLPQKEGEQNFSSNSCFNTTNPVQPKPPLPNFVKSFGLLKRQDVGEIFFQNFSPISPADTRILPVGTKLTVVTNTSCHKQETLALKANTLEILEPTPISQIEKSFWEDPCVISISPEIELKTFATTNDTYFSDLTHLTTINAPQAYDFLLGGSGPTANVTIAIIDTGVAINHTDLSANIWVNTAETGGNGIDDDGNGYIDDVNGYNFASNIPNPSPQVWPSPNTGGESHGTHVAGLAAAKANNNTGITGVMGTNIKIMSLNVFGATASASTTNLINAINYATANKANIINLSLGGYGVSNSVQQALINATNAGVVVFAAAGNDSATLDDALFMLPASYAMNIQGMISVGATDDINGDLAGFSNKSNRYVEISAPGTHSSYGGLKSTLPGNAYGYKQGTSMATPVAAGLGAWAISYMKTLGRSPSAATAEQYILESSDAVQSLQPFISSGRRINLLKLVNTINDCYR